MIDHAQFAREFNQWYVQEARQFLSDVASDRVTQLDQELARLERLSKALEGELPICFLGTAGVGKSTLINAIVAGRDVVLPAGGVGPLTAEATVVRYSRHRQFRATYHPPTKLNRVLFVLERAYEKELNKQGLDAQAEDDGLTASLSEAERLEAELALNETADANEPGRFQVPDLVGALTRQAAHLIRGDQYAALEKPYLLDRLRDCLEAERRWGTQPMLEDMPRLNKVKEVLARAKREERPLEVRASDKDGTFRGELELHAAGHLAPLVRSIEVGWDSEVLRQGLVLVDLPGLGIANDEFRHVASYWIRRARGVVLVVERSGMSEASADLLRSSGFLNSLLHDSDDPEDLNATLLVAVVKLDATADDARTREKQSSAVQVRPWISHFDEACQKAVSMIREQLSIELQKVSEQGGASTRLERSSVIRRVLEGMQVHPVVAPEYRKLLAADDDEPPKIKQPEQSRIPALVRSLAELVTERNARIDARIEFLSRNLGERVRGIIELAKARSEQEGSARQRQAERIRADLLQYAAPLREEFINKQGEFREFLRSTVPSQIEARVDAAAAAARNDIAKHLQKYFGYHWGTIRAAVRRGGVFDGSSTIDIPNDLSLLFEEPVAIVWSTHILGMLRTRTASIGHEYVSIVGDLVKWAAGQNEGVDTKILEAMHRELQAEMKGLAEVGNEAIDELRAAVKGDLYTRVEAQVRQRCQEFVRTGNDQGHGVKTRMMALLRELADAVVDAARPIAREVLRRQYKPVEEEIRAAFDKYRNPIDTAVNEILGDTANSEHQRTVKRQRQIASAAQALLAGMPALAQVNAVELPQ